MRPLAVNLMLCGFDQEYQKPMLYKIDPSGYIIYNYYFFNKEILCRV